MKFQPYTFYSSPIYEGYIYTTSVTDHSVRYIPICFTDSILSMSPHQFAVNSSLAYNLSPVSAQTIIPDLQGQLTLADLQTNFPELFI